MKRLYFSVVRWCWPAAGKGREELYRNFAGKCIAAAISLLALSLHGEAKAATCLSGTCHAEIGATKFLHGPVASEQAGRAGCVACHVPAGKPCSQGEKGVFKPLAPSAMICQLCHSSGTGTQHSTQKIDCLKCHDPHGSNKGAELQR